MENISIALLCTILGFSVSFLTYQRNGKKDIEEKAKKDAERKTQLDYIQKGIDDIRFNDRVRDEQLKTMNERLIIVENETKVLFQRFKRLDEHYHIRDELEHLKGGEH